MTTIIITGTPGVGKSTLAEALRKKDFWRLDIHHYYEDISTAYNRSKQCYDLDMKKVEKLVKEKIKEHPKIVIDSHVAHLLPSKLVDLCVVLVCSDLKLLQKRLEKRGYTQKKVRENLDAEIFQICLLESLENGHNVMIFDVGKKQSLKKMVDAIYLKTK
ncbi:MAG: AAA family ATPase [archaeon]|nr:AAA family ATPase [archaeon]